MLFISTGFTAFCDRYLRIIVINVREQHPEQALRVPGAAVPVHVIRAAEEAFDA